jgi:hypothetical protein
MIRGSCLCGGVKFEVARIVGPFELCHCTRCRKASGSAFVAGLGIMRKDLRIVHGLDLIRTYEAPIRQAPPPYRTCFCGRCGSPLPDTVSSSSWLEIPAGLLDDDPGLRPDKHIYVDVKSTWFVIADDLPQFDKAAIRRYRETHPRPRE